MQQQEQPAAKTLTEAEAASYLGISRSYLTASRLSNPRTVGPPFVRFGRAVRYVISDLDAWLKGRRVGGPEVA